MKLTGTIALVLTALTDATHLRTAATVSDTDNNALSCPSGYAQSGAIGADKSGCGIEGCAARYGSHADNVDTCRNHCDSNSKCESFSYAPENGDKNHQGKKVCTIYTSTDFNQKWKGKDGKYMQIACVKSEVPLVAPEQQIKDLWATNKIRKKEIEDLETKTDSKMKELTNEIEELQGKAAVAGPKGDKGDKGDKGNTGAKGAKGSKGNRGAKGAKGSKGSKGNTGAKGAKGNTGAKGAKGSKGNRGAKGAKGSKGSKGNTGARGAKGSKGNRGATGAKGSKGPKGDTGGCTGAVDMYQHNIGSGWKASFKKGQYNHGQMTGKGMKNDDMSSMVVPQGCRVTIYEHGSFNGWQISLGEGRYMHADLMREGKKQGVTNFNDQVSSVKVE